MSEQSPERGEPVVADGVEEPAGPLLTPDPPRPPGESAADLDLEPSLDPDAAAGERVVPDEDVNPDAAAPEPPG